MAIGSFVNTVFASPAEDFDLRFTGFPPLPRVDFRLGSRRFCGGDFLTRWSVRRWGARLVADGVARTGRFLAIPYGPNHGDTQDHPRSQVSYLERLEEQAAGDFARPDFLILPRAASGEAEYLLGEVGGSAALPFRDEDDPHLRRLLDLSGLALQCRTTLGQAKDRLPNIAVEHEAMERLASWQSANEVPVHLAQVFLDTAFGIRLDRALESIRTRLVEPTTRIFQLPGGALVEKTMYEIPLDHGYRFGRMTVEPAWAPARLKDQDGQILPYVRVEGGRLDLTPEAARLLSGVEGDPNPR